MSQLVKPLLYLFVLFFSASGARSSPGVGEAEGGDPAGAEEARGDTYWVRIPWKDMKLKEKVD